MPQGNLKTKVKVPKSVAAKSKAKGKAVTKRSNAPVTPKKKKQEAQKLKKAITKTVNAAAEEELRALAFDGKKTATKTRAAAKKKK